ncbi:MAG: hypothetical protein FWE10_08825 [Rikenellaceae bacterium]|nr:hypothetical protein [Rikenellaceae bacterium]MCL2692351.1 hypothetical protein [Rikenellaceae bacterium]
MKREKFQKQLVTTIFILIIPAAVISVLVERSGSEQVISIAKSISVMTNIFFIAYLIVIRRNKLIKFEDEVKKHKD